jgi:hypothetical protein
MGNYMSWLPFLDAYRTMRMTPRPEFEHLLEEIHELNIAASAGAPAT